MARKKRDGFSYDKCPNCNGTGEKSKYYYKDNKKITEKYRCPTCRGTGRRMS